MYRLAQTRARRGNLITRLGFSRALAEVPLTIDGWEEQVLMDRFQITVDGEVRQRSQSPIMLQDITSFVSSVNAFYVERGSALSQAKQYRIYSQPLLSLRSTPEGRHTDVKGATIFEDISLGKTIPSLLLSYLLCIHNFHTISENSFGTIIQ